MDEYRKLFWYYIILGFSDKLAARLARADIDEARADGLPAIAGHLTIKR